MPRKTCPVTSHSLVKLFVYMGLFFVRDGSSFKKNSLNENQLLITKSLLEVQSVVPPEGEYLLLLDSPTIIIACRDNANISVNLDVTLDDEMRRQPLIMISYEESVGFLSGFPQVQSHFVLVRTSNSLESEFKNSYAAYIAHIRDTPDGGDRILEWEPVEICVPLDISFAVALVSGPESVDSGQYFEILSSLSITKDANITAYYNPRINPDSLELLQYNDTSLIMNISGTHGTAVHQSHDVHINSVVRDKRTRDRLRGLILPESQKIYKTFRYYRHSATEQKLRKPTHLRKQPQQSDQHYISELKAAAVHYITGFGNNCSTNSDSRANIGVSLSSEEIGAKSSDAILDFYFNLLDLQCYSTLRNTTMKLFESGLLIPYGGFQVNLNLPIKLATKRILSPTEFEEIISAFYFTSFSKSYFTLINNQSPVKTPLGKLISSSTRLVTGFTLNFLHLLTETSPHKSFIDFHLIKTLSRFTQTLAYFYLTLLNEGNQLVCQDHEESFSTTTTTACQAIRKIKFNNSMQIAGLIHFLIHKIPDLISFQSNLDFNSQYAQHIRQNQEKILNFVRKSMKINQ